jgi:hypothetical protein
VLNIPIISEPYNAEIKKALENIKTKFQSYYEIAGEKVVSGDILPSNDILFIISDDFKIHSEIIKIFKLWILL